jgi:flagellar hook-associated protein 1 FlgK
MTSFSGLTNAASALNAERYAMQIAGQNIANADTAGYTRERADLVATGPVSGVSRLYAASHSVSGSVTVTGTSRLNDPVIDSRARTEHSRSGYFDTKAATIGNVETDFDEPSDGGLAEQLNAFWKSWSTVSTYPADESARTALLQQAQGVASTLNEMSTNLATISASVQQALASSAAQIQDAANAVGDLNAAITVATATGAPAANLQDQRDVLLSKLAELGGGQAQLQPDGSVTVTIGGQTLVAGTTVSTVTLDGTGKNITVGGTAVVLTGGAAQAQSELLNTTLPGYQSQLDSVANALASTVNTQHQAGQDLNGTAGGPFFAGAGAASISVAITDPRKVAAAAATGTASLDGSNAQAIAAMGLLPNGADAIYRTLVAKLGSDSAQATQQSATQAAITSNVDTLQSQASGVSYDDEVTNLLTFQRAYQASSRVLTTIDEMLDTLINHTGRAGL